MIKLFMHINMVSKSLTIKAAALCCIIGAGIKKKNNRKKRKWMRKFFINRSKGSFDNIFHDLENHDSDLVQNYVRMPSHIFAWLLNQILPKIKKEENLMRDSISPGKILVKDVNF